MSAGGVGLAVVLALLSACSGSPSHPDRTVAQLFLDAYGRGDAVAAGAQTTNSAVAATSLKRSLDGLGGTARARFAISSVTPKGKTESTVAYSASWTLPGSTAKWAYTGTLPLARTKAAKANSGWQVTWAARDAQPDLTPGQHVRTVRVQPPRASLDDRAGKALFTPTAVVSVSINTARVTDANALARALAKALDISAAGILATIKATPKGQAAPVITLRRSAYLKVKSKIYTLPGTQFSTGTELLGPSSHFAQPLLGQVGPATKEIIDASKGAVVAGDQTGLSGLQRAFNPQLAGTPGLAVYAASDQTNAIGVKLADIAAAVPGRAVRLSLDRADQSAAEATLASVKKPAAIVVLQPTTGQVLAAANSSAATDDIALVGQFPPGSSFKIATYTAAFTANPKLSPASKAACPGHITVNGQNVHNENNFAKGTIPLSSAFAFSCNTTAARLGLTLPATSLRTSAAALGLGADWSSLPVDAFSGSLPAPVSPNEVAADAYGQGKVLASPLLMAEMAGAATTGRSVVPALVTGETPVRGVAQPARVTTYLNTIMRDVVTMPGATAHALNSLPGSIQGKTGTADFGTANPPKAHSWFAGTRGAGAGQIAFGVFIYGGGSSVTGAVPVAKTLLTKLP
jgi:cell division protein FtsI/penicillin-binding protein 2